MIHFITGLPGGGKSYTAVRHVVRELLHGERFIVTNLPLKLPELAEYCHEHGKDVVDVGERVRLLTEEETGEFWLYEGPGRKHEGRRTVKQGNKVLDVPDFSDRSGRGVLYVLDEVHITFSARSWQSTGEQVTYYLSQHRKVRDDVILISQHPDQVDKALRRLCQDFTYVTNFNNSPVMGFRLGRYFRWSTTRFPKSPRDGQPQLEGGYFKMDTTGLGRVYETAQGVGIMGKLDPKKESHGAGRNVIWAIPIVLCIGAGIVYFPRTVGAMVSKGINGFVGGMSKVTSNAVTTVTSTNLGLSPGDRAPVARPGRALEIPSVPATAVTIASMFGTPGKVIVGLSDGRILRQAEGDIEIVNERICKAGGVIYKWGVPGVAAAPAAEVREMPARRFRGR